MKKISAKRILLILTIQILIITLFQGFSFANNENIQMIKKSEKEFLIYVRSLENKKFQFAFSNSKEADKNNLLFEESALDKKQDGKNIAYINSNIYSTFFENKEKTFLWIKEGENYKIEGLEINLEEALSEKEIQDINNITKKIEVKIGTKKLPDEIDVDGSKIQKEIGTIKIKNNPKYKYSYIIMESEEKTDIEKFISLANQINQEDESTYNKLKIYNDFYELYKKIEPTAEDAKWKIAEKNIVEQPQEFNKQDGYQYLVWLKQEGNNEEVMDVQIMTCKAKNTPIYEKQEVIVKTASKLPITGDNIILFVILGVIIVAIVIAVIMKNNNKNKEEKVNEKNENEEQK